MISHFILTPRTRYPPLMDRKLGTEKYFPFETIRFLLFNFLKKERLKCGPERIGLSAAELRSRLRHAILHDSRNSMIREQIYRTQLNNYYSIKVLLLQSLFNQRYLAIWEAY